MTSEKSAYPLGNGRPGPFAPNPDLMDTSRTAGGGRRQKRPNVLWIQTDEQRPDSLGCYGSDWARTPNLDRLAAQGTTFTNCVAPSPVCVPSRTAMMFCKPPQQTGVMDNDAWGRDGIIDPAIPTWVNLFANAGYRTINMGKWHTPNHPTWQENNFFDIFHDVCGYYGLGHCFTGAEESLRLVQRPKSDPIILGGKYPHHDWGENPASFLTDLAVDRLSQLSGENEEPWLLRVSYIWPHTPVLAPDPWDRVYDPSALPWCADRLGAYRTRSAFDRQFADMQGGLQMDEATWRRCAADYYGLCALIDAEVGRLMRSLVKHDLLESTIVVFTSDHGRSLGEAGLCEKGTFDNEVWRVPLIIRQPGDGASAGRILRHPVSLMQLGPTLMRLCGISPAKNIADDFLFDEMDDGVVFGLIRHGGTIRAAARNASFRYDCTVSEEGAPVPAERSDPNLFNVVEDPAEMTNLALRGHHEVLSEMRGKLVSWLQRTAHPDLAPLFPKS
jgi:choline-sulfatase